LASEGQRIQLLQPSRSLDQKLAAQGTRILNALR
jgi:hypothetical protein